MSLLAEKINWGAQDLRTAIIYTSLAMGFTLLFILFQQKSSQSKKFKILYFCIHIVFFAAYIVPALFIAYTINYGASIDRTTVTALLQSDYKEVWEHAISFIPLHWAFIASIVSAIFITLLLKQKKIKGIEIKTSCLVIPMIVTFALGLGQLKHPKIPKLIIISSYQYARELILFRKFQSSRAIEVGIMASKNEEDELYIVAIGESLNKQHMSLYGYPRETSPNLSIVRDEGELLIFTNAYSSHTHTTDVLSLSLTEANQLNKKKYHQSPSIINIINKSRTETHWISNQNLMGVWDNLISVIALESKNVVSLNSTIGKRVRPNKYDEEMIKELETILMKNTNKSRVIFVHLIGNHTHYCSRYPKKYSLFTDNLRPEIFGSTVPKKSHWGTINCYDNSVLYNDYVVSSLLKVLQKKDGISGFFYLSDHSEDVFNNLGHNSGNFTYDMTEIPMIAWLSGKYRKRYPNKFRILSKNTSTIYPNDFLYDTLIGLFNIKTKNYNSKYDLSSPNYSLNANQAYTLSGKRKYTDKSNNIYWTRKNTSDLIKMNQSNRVFLSNANSLGKLKEAWNNGFRSFEFNLWFTKDGLLRLGRNANSLGSSLKDYLKAMEYKKIKRLVFKLKNLDEKNYKEVLEQLEHINKIFKIKNKTIIISSSNMLNIQKKGWSVSHYIPPTTSKPQKWALKISQELNKISPLMLSFDKELYPMVKRYLEPKIGKNISYNIRHTLHLEESSFISLLKKDRIFMDKRVKTILIPNKSKFDL